MEACLFRGHRVHRRRPPPSLKLSRAVTDLDVHAGFRDLGARRPDARGSLEAGPGIELHVVVLDAEDDVVPQRVFEADAGRPAALAAARMVSRAPVLVTLVRYSTSPEAQPPLK